MGGTRQVVAVTYFALTTLSTVGLGDYHPKNSAERVVVSIALGCGVATMSVVIGNFIHILHKFQKLFEDNEESAELGRFYSLLKRLNMNHDLPLTLKRQMDKFFVHKWQNDKNMAIQTPQERQNLR